MRLNRGGDSDDEFVSRLEVNVEEHGTAAQVCKGCGLPLHKHDRERVFPDDGPAGSYHFEYRCPHGGLTRDQVV